MLAGVHTDKILTIPCVRLRSSASFATQRSEFEARATGCVLGRSLESGEMQITWLLSCGKRDDAAGVPRTNRGRMFCIVQRDGAAVESGGWG